MLGLIAAYCVIHVVSRRVAGFDRYFGSTLVHALLVALYVAGFFRVPAFGGGRGQLAAVTFLGGSLIVAGVRAITGCGLMAISDIFPRKNIEQGLLMFLPLDKLERKLRIR